MALIQKENLGTESWTSGKGWHLYSVSGIWKKAGHFMKFCPVKIVYVSLKLGKISRKKWSYRFGNHSYAFYVPGTVQSVLYLLTN